MLIKLYKIRVFFLLIATFLLCQCTQTVNSTVATPAPVALSKKKVNPYSMPAASYLALAKNQEGIEKQNSLILAAGRLISEGQWRQGVAILAQTADLTPVLLDEKNILLAQIDVMRDRPNSAISKLSHSTEKENLPDYQQIQYHELLAQAYRSTGKPLESIAERIKLEPLLADEERQINNRQALWLTLTHVPQVDLDAFAIESANKSEEQGWLQLARIARQYRDNPKSLLAALDQWQSQFYSHPANQMLPNPLDSIANKMLAQPKHMALLLPVTGTLAGPGMAVRDGFMAAYKNNNAEASTEIKTYDSNKEDIAELYQKAISDGADYVVGPLTKSQVAVIAGLPHPVPTLLLNDSDANVQENSYLFGLSPVNEAMQVATKARSKGYSRALVIAPNNSWGNEVTKAFSNQLQKYGGHVMDTFLYGSNEDLNKKMQDFLHITNSQAREKRIKEILGQKVQTSISRRQDFDMIFLLAYPSKARQIMPLLNYYYAGDVPVFATSSVYGGNANALKDKDLDGIIFCDIPWVFSHQMGSRNWPEQFNSYNRLYALGMDSYALATQLNQLLLFPADGSNDRGILYLNHSQHVARVLEWGQFRQGLVHSLGETV